MAINHNNLNIRTTNGKTFTAEDHYALARLIYKRFGCDPEAAVAAWRRLLQNNATTEDFLQLVNV